MKWTPFEVERQELKGFKFDKVGRIQVKEVDLILKRTEYVPEMMVRDDAKMNIKYLDKRFGINIGYIRAIEELEDGRIMFTSGSQLVIYDSYNLKFYSCSYEFGEVMNLNKGKSGRLWVSTTSGCYYFENDRFYHVQTPGVRVSQSVYEDSEGSCMGGFF